MAAFDFGEVAVQDPLKGGNSDRLSKLDSKVLVDPPLEEYPDIVFRKANSDSDKEDVLKDHPEPK